MRAAKVVPVFKTPEEHDAFRKQLGPDAADAYDVWLKLLGDQREEAIRRGEWLVEVEVKLDEFKAFCRATGAPADMNTLRLFAVKKAEGQG